MGNPQIEDGYTRIANELLEAIRCNGCGFEWFEVDRNIFTLQKIQPVLELRRNFIEAI